MVKTELLEDALLKYKNHGMHLKPKKFNRDEFFNLFKKYNYYGMTEYSYCCYGEERCCWIEPTEDGVWDLTLKDVKSIMLDTIKDIKHEIRYRKYGDRFYIYKNKDYCFVYIYARDTIHKTDFRMWFSNREYTNMQD